MKPSPEQSKRLHAPDVNYFGPEKGPFRCGHCEYFNLKENFCEHPHVQAPVNYSGCCNKYQPQ